ncbi:MAG TPA: hypothetical protein PKA00_01615 [Saprospiraceae bacterium]|nr:hypothetical protein [Saprospiraceae bacterium]HMQ81567.1 hypothetical protein [Saprospiraceae bacterium]
MIIDTLTKPLGAQLQGHLPPDLKKDDGKLSVDIASKTTPEISIIDSKKISLWGFKAKVPFDIGLRCIYDPIQENGYANLAHAIIVGFQEEDEALPGILARAAIKVKD